jgi:hypothetical protein
VQTSVADYIEKGVSADLSLLVQTFVGKWVAKGQQISKNYMEDLRRLEALPNRWRLQQTFAAWRFCPPLVKKRTLARYEKDVQKIRHYSLQCLLVRSFQYLWENLAAAKIQKLDEKRRRLNLTETVLIAVGREYCLSTENLLAAHGQGKLTPAGPTPEKIFVARPRCLADREWGQCRMSVPQCLC